MFKKSIMIIEKNKYNLLAIFDYIIFSLSNLFMKLASQQASMVKQIIWYFISMICLFIFSILWQILLKNMNLNKAYLFKGTTLLWGIVFGFILFNEQISVNMLIGTVIVLIGIVITFYRGEGNE